MASENGRREFRRWDHGAATTGDVDEVRHWVVWGTGQPPGGILDGAKPGSDIARKIAEGRDEDWASEHGWVLVVEADEDDVDLLAQDEESVRGYDAYLIEAEAAAAEPTIMEGRLHGDEVQRRPFDVDQRT
jgi:hypothetical protein